jgi:hypothetical protein
MSPQEPEEPLPADDLQFDHAEYDQAEAEPALVCAACKQEIADRYYQLQGKLLCERCQDYIQRRLTSGSGFVRFVRALVYGIGAGVVGFAIYAGVLVILHLHWAVISILVGFLVGSAVRKGGEGRGGLPYQLLAVFLTYSAIGASLVVPYAKQLWDQTVRAEVKPRAPEQAREVADRGNGVARLEEQAPHVPTPMWIRILAFSFGLVVISYAAPFLGGFDPLTWLIVFFALWQAWILNRKIKLQVSGPFQVGGEPSRGEVTGYA